MSDVLKICTACKLSKPLSEYNKNRSRKDGRQSRCRECDRKRGRELYAKGTYLKTILERRRERKTAKKQYLWDYLLKNPCSHCGEQDPVVLEFDHLDPNLKVAAVSEMASDDASYEAIDREISKCQILCANCHRRKTSLELGWFRGSDE